MLFEEQEKEENQTQFDRSSNFPAKFTFIWPLCT